VPFFTRWRKERQLQRHADAYVATLLRDPSDADVAWLAAAATRGDDDHARWELRYARRAIGLLVAQRDAMDDRTASIVAQVLGSAFEADEHIDQGRFGLVERQFNARLSAYRDAMAVRSSDTGTRLGQTLLAFSGGSFRDIDETVRRGGEVMASYESDANEALRSAFGTAALPENIAPSAAAGSSAK
jgi:hypothetical protein